MQIKKKISDTAFNYECYCAGKQQICSTSVILETMCVSVPCFSMNHTEEPKHHSCANMHFLFYIRSRLSKILEQTTDPPHTCDDMR